MNRMLLAKAVGVGAVLSLGASMWTGAAETPAPAPKGPTAGEQFKNIKVLRDLPADQLMATMQEYNKALNVKCDFCHVGGDFASDANKMKLVTRDMILLTRRLNENEPSVGKHVTCFMCHHGQAHPASRAEEVKKPAETGGAAKPAGTGAKQGTQGSQGAKSGGAGTTTGAKKPGSGKAPTGAKKG